MSEIAKYTPRDHLRVSETAVSTARSMARAPRLRGERVNRRQTRRSGVRNGGKTVASLFLKTDVS